MTPDAIATEIVDCRQMLSALAQVNVYGRTNDELIDLELRIMEYRKRLLSAEAARDAWIKEGHQ